VANVNLPVPVAVAGGCLLLLGGYLIGAVAGPQASDPTVATVDSYTPTSRELCLSGDAVADDPAAKDGVLCGEWRRTPGSAAPRKGDTFRFVQLDTSRDGDDKDASVYLYGDVESRG
jgi:hypothetical protein